MAKFDTWEVERAVDAAGNPLPYGRRKWERPIFKWVQAELPGHDETDILWVVAKVFADLEKVELREGSTERSKAALVRLVARRRAWKTRREWQAEGYETPLQPLGKRHPAGKDNVARERPTIGTTSDGSEDEEGDERNENSWGDSWSGDPARIYERQKTPAELTKAQVAEKYGLSLDEVNLVLSTGPKSGADRVRLHRIRERMKKKLLGENEKK